MKTRLLFFLALLSVLVFLFATAFQLDVDFTDFAATLAWIISGGGAVAIAIWVSSLLDAKWPKWAALDPVLKNFIGLIASSALAIGASILLRQTQIVEAIQPWYAIIVPMVIAWLGGTLYLVGHKRGTAKTMLKYLPLRSAKK